MYDFCKKCETKGFCADVERCLDGMIETGFGEAEVHDIRDDKLSDPAGGLKKIKIEATDPDEVLSKEIKNIIKAAIN